MNEVRTKMYDQYFEHGVSYLSETAKINHSIYLFDFIDNPIRMPTAPRRGRNAYVRHFDNVPMDSL